MGRDKYSRSPSRSKKSKRSKSRDRERDRYRDYDRDKDRKYKKSSKSSRSRDYSPDSRSKKRDRYRRRSSSSSDNSSSRSPSHSSSRSSSRYKSSSRRDKVESRSRSESRSKSTGPTAPPPPIISERFNFQDAVGVLDTNRDTVADIERNEFTPQTFSSTATKKLPDKVKIDLDMGTIELPPMPNQDEEVDILVNPKFFGDEKERMQRWVRKMMLYRQPRMETN